MSNYQEQECSFFESLIAPWVKAYRHALFAYVGVKTTDGTRLIVGRIVLNAFDELSGVTPFHFESTHLVAGRYVLDVADHGVTAILERLRSGQILAIDGATISLQSDGSLGAYCSPVRHAFLADNIRVPNICVSGISRHKLLSGIERHLELDWELKSASEPFDSLDDLLRHCGLPSQSESGDLTSLEVVAGCPVIVTDKSLIADGEAIVECRMATALRAEEFRLGYKLFRGGGEIERRASVAGTDLVWNQQNGVKIGTFRLKVGEAHLLQAFASYSGIAQHQWWIADANKRLNPRFAIHQIFDDDLEILRTQLFKPQSDKAHMFEQAVSTLFSLAGFSASNYGRIPKLQKGPDIIAVSPAGHVGVVECTLGLINENDKLAKLVQRTGLVKDRLSGAGFAHLQVLPVVVTPLSRVQITANLEEAGKLGVAVICKEDIEGMIGQIRLPLNPDKLFEDAKNLVPGIQGQTAGKHGGL